MTKDKKGLEEIDKYGKPINARKQEGDFGFSPAQQLKTTILLIRSYENGLENIILSKTSRPSAREKKKPRETREENFAVKRIRNKEYKIKRSNCYVINVKEKKRQQRKREKRNDMKIKVKNFFFMIIYENCRHLKLVSQQVRPKAHPLSVVVRRICCILQQLVPILLELDRRICSPQV